MKPLVRNVYVRAFDEFVLDLIKYENIVTKWKVEYPRYLASVTGSVEAGEIYVIEIVCKKPLEN